MQARGKEGGRGEEDNRRQREETNTKLLLENPILSKSEQFFVLSLGNQDNLNKNCFYVCHTLWVQKHPRPWFLLCNCGSNFLAQNFMTLLIT